MLPFCPAKLQLRGNKAQARLAHSTTLNTNIRHIPVKFRLHYLPSSYATPGAGARAEVQFGHRTAPSGILEQQNGQDLVVGAGDGAGDGAGV